MMAAGVLMVNWAKAVVAKAATAVRVEKNFIVIVFVDDKLRWRVTRLCGLKG